jgi:predicted NBD/HSP70 family sugar kinase
MRFYTKQHLYYCGVDLHARSMFICIIDNQGNTIAHKNIQTDPDCFLKIIAPYREDIVVAVECIFIWYWLTHLC